MEMEERTIEQLPDKCSNCGGTLTDAEKERALVEGTESEAVLCDMCADEQVELDDPGGQSGS